MVVVAKVFDEVSAGWGLILSVPKTKLLVVSVLDCLLMTWPLCR